MVRRNLLREAVKSGELDEAPSKAEVYPLMLFLKTMSTVNGMPLRAHVTVISGGVDVVHGIAAAHATSWSPLS